MNGVLGGVAFSGVVVNLDAVVVVRDGVVHVRRTGLARCRIQHDVKAPDHFTDAIRSA
jgi:hypothetical protein